MFLYQSFIMLAVILIVCLFAYVIKVKNHTILVSILLVSIIAGGLGMYAVQNYFGIHFYTQDIDTSAIQKIEISNEQAGKIRQIFNDYKDISSDRSPDTSTSATAGRHANQALKKTYSYNKNGVHSTIETTVYTFSSKQDADSYFDISQKIYENKTYLPADSKKSQKEEEFDPRYIVSLVKSNYDDVNDLMYLPSKMSYLSSLTIETGNVIMIMEEKSNNVSSNKDLSVQDILKKIGKS